MEQQSPQFSKLETILCLQKTDPGPEMLKVEKISPQSTLGLESTTGDFTLDMSSIEGWISFSSQHVLDRPSLSFSSGPKFHKKWKWIVNFVQQQRQIVQWGNLYILLFIESRENKLSFVHTTFIHQQYIYVSTTVQPYIHMSFDK